MNSMQLRTIPEKNSDFTRKSNCEGFFHPSQLKLGGLRRLVDFLSTIRKGSQLTSEGWRRISDTMKKAGNSWRPMKQVLPSQIVPQTLGARAVSNMLGVST